MRRTLPPQASLIPAHAKCVFRGVIFDVYQWEQELFDGSTTTFEMLKRADSIAVYAIDNHDQIVTIDEEQPNGFRRIGGLPVGSSEDYDESILAAAKREFLEETGLIFKNWRLLTVRQPEVKIEFFVNVFIATDLIDEIPQNLDPGEKITVTRTDFEALRAQNPYHRSNLSQFSDVTALRRFVEEAPESD